mgnify:CR=1 FL=1
MKTKKELLESCSLGDNTNIWHMIAIEVLIDIRDNLSEIEKRLTEIGGQVEDIGGEARMNVMLKNR